jgi:hypothetical protein
VIGSTSGWYASGHVSGGLVLTFARAQAEVIEGYEAATAALVDNAAAARLRRREAAPEVDDALPPRLRVEPGERLLTCLGFQTGSCLRTTNKSWCIAAGARRLPLRLREQPRRRCWTTLLVRTSSTSYELAAG